MGLSKTIGKINSRLMGLLTVWMAATIVFGLLGMTPSTVLASKKNNTVIIGMSQEPFQFNPLLWENAGTDQVPQACMFDTLWDVRPDGSFSPNLVAKLPTVENGGISADGITWKIELKKGVKWQDGKPFTAADVEFTYQCAVNPKINVVRGRDGFDRIKEFKVIDDYNIEFTLKETFAPMYWVWKMMGIVPKHVLSKVEDINNCEWNTTGTFGTGPYKLVKRVAGSHMVYKANPNYHMGMPKIETVIHKFVPDQTVLFTQVKTGEVDFLALPGIFPERYEAAKKIKHLDIMLTPRPSTEYLLFNGKKPWFKDKRVRQALYMGFDKDEILRVTRYGLEKRTLSYVNPGHWAHNTNLKDPGYNPEKAAELLDAAGWKMGSDGVREKDGLKLAFNFSTTVGDKSREQGQLIVQKYLKKLGVAVKIKNFTPPVMWGEFFFDGKFDMIFIASPLRLGTDPDFSGLFNMVKNRFNCYQDNEELEKLRLDGTRVVDRETRKKIYDRAQEILLDECSLVPFFQPAEIFAKNKDLGGYEKNPYSYDVTCFIREWYWK